MYRLSILIPTINGREPFLNDLIFGLLLQSSDLPVQIIWLGDNLSLTTGAKRNKLIQIADGDYISFVDDDDHVSESYVSDILKALDGTDCIGIGGHHTFDGKQKGIYDFSPNHGKNHHERIDGVKYMRYLPNHLCVWRKETAQRVPFPDKSLAEDHEWAEKQALLGYTFKSIGGNLYHYDLRRAISMRYRK